MRAPSAASSAPASGSSVTTATSRTAGQASAAATVSSANARASRGRSSSPTAAASLLLASAKGFSGMTRDQRAAVAVFVASPPSGRRPARPGGGGLHCHPPGGSLSGPGRTVFSTDQGPGATLAPAATQGQSPGPQRPGRGPQRKVSECPAAESASGTAWRRSSQNRRWSFCSSGTGGEWRTFRPTADSSPPSITTRTWTCSPTRISSTTPAACPRFLAKAALFKAPGSSGPCCAARARFPSTASPPTRVGAFRAAVDAVERGECVAFYPEGTLTRDPGQWPMTAKTGVARVALMTRAPVIPVAQWGANLAMPPYAKEKKVRLLPAQDAPGEGRPAGRPRPVLRQGADAGGAAAR